MKAFWVESAGLGLVAPLTKDQSLYGKPVPTWTPEATGMGLQRSFLASLVPSGLEVLRLWCQTVPGSSLGPTRARLVTSQSFRFPALGSLISPQRGVSIILCAQFQGEPDQS